MQIKLALTCKQCLYLKFCFNAYDMVTRGPYHTDSFIFMFVAVLMNQHMIMIKKTYLLAIQNPKHIMFNVKDEFFEP